MPSKSKQNKRKKSTGVMSNSLIRGSANVAQIHQTLQLKPNLRDIYASQGPSQKGGRHPSNANSYNAQVMAASVAVDSFSTGPTSQKVFRRSGTNTSNNSNPRGRKRAPVVNNSVQPKMILLNNSVNRNRNSQSPEMDQLSAGGVP